MIILYTGSVNLSHPRRAITQTQIRTASPCVYALRACVSPNRKKRTLQSYPLRRGHQEEDLQMQIWVGWLGTEKYLPVEPKVRLQGYGYNPFCSHSSRCLAVPV